MKRKFQYLPEIPKKKARVNPCAETAIQLLRIYGERLTLAELNYAFPDLSIARIHELLEAISTNYELRIFGVSNLIKILLSQVFSLRYKTTDPSPGDLCTLILKFKYSEILPRMGANIYNTWLRNLAVETPSVLRWLPDILICLEKLIPKHIDFNKDIDRLDLNIISNALLKFANLASTEQLTEKNDVIFFVIHTFFYTKNARFQGHLDPASLKTLFDSCEYDKYFSTIVFHYASLMHRTVLLTCDISLAGLTKSFTTLLEIDFSELIQLFEKLSILYQKVTFFNKTKAASAEDLQEFFNAIIEKNLEIDALSQIIFHLGTFIHNNVTRGEIDGLQEALHTILSETKKMDLHNLLYTLGHLAPVLKKPLDIGLIEPLIKEGYLYSKTNARLTTFEKSDLSHFFSLVRKLNQYSKLSGNFTEQSLDILYFIANSKSKNLDLQTLLRTLSFFGVYLLHGQLKPEIVNRLTTDLFNHFFKIKCDACDMDPLFFTILNIVASKKFPGVFNTKLLDSFLHTLTLNRKTEPYKNFDYVKTLGLAAKHNHIQNFPARTLKNFLMTCLSSSNPTYLFISATSIANFLAADAFDNNQRELEEFFDSLLNGLIREKISYDPIKWKKHTPSIADILKLPQTAREKVLYNFLPVMIEMIHETPDTQAINAIVHALKQFTQSKNRYKYPPIATPKELTVLLEHFYEINNFDPKALLHSYVVAADLFERKMDPHSLIYTLIEHILPAKILQAHVTREETRHYRIPLLTVILEFINVDEPNAILIADLFDAMRILTEQKKLSEEKSLIIAEETEPLMQKVLKLIISMPELQIDQLVSILKGFFCLLKHDLIFYFDAELLFVCFIRLGRLDIMALYDIFSECSTSLITSEDYTFETVQDWINDASDATPAELTDLCKKIPSILFMDAVSMGNIDFIEMFLSLVIEEEDASDTITTACETAFFLPRHDIVALLLKSGVLTDNAVELLLKKVMHDIDFENNPTETIFLLYTMMTWKGIQADFVTVALKCIESLINASHANLMPRLNNVITYSRMIEKHGLFYTPDRHSEYYDIDYGDARDIMSFRK